ncbi:LPS-assembly protein LptD [Mucilaginibacter robiniae]|uniref:LPS-assembly protein LptD n=1 Tax=Mucilaginibacter robiniae TaxID=2728022 RepID=A0A7L5E7N4_9SPHI|nr:putative LPS assembly protein LptD [Mucilaginibacter robiniae]QJD97844.1 LPS-assembly protein LptD [Mucilaginibacter robiniae]
MKLVSFFFLLGTILILNSIAIAGRHSYSKPVLLADTIIKLDTVKDKKILAPAKARENARTKKGGAKSASATNDTTKKSKSGLKSQVNAKGDDLSYFDIEKNIGYYYGNARVTYEDFELDADFIRVDKNKHLIFASGLVNPKTHRYQNKPIAKSKGQNPVIADSLYYNYETKKIKAWNTSGEQEGNYITGGQTKKLNETEVAYNNILFSTCSLPYPETHFGIVITKGIGEKNKIISGPAYLEIEGVPLPIAIPFGFFPKPDHRTSGVILPSFGEDSRLGFYLRQFGYYVGINDNLDLTTTGTLYSRGSFEAGTTARYLKRYEYQGTLTFNFGAHNYGVQGDPYQKDFSVIWNHSQDANAHPGSTFSASVNAATSTFYQNNVATTNYNVQAITQNNLRSSIAYSKTWAGTPFNFTANLSHSQDLTAKTVSLELPTFNFNMTSISPFDSKDRVGDQKWYQRITVAYSLQGTNKINSEPESQIFKGDNLLKKLQSGFQHQIPIGLNLNVLKYFQFNANSTYTERWYFQSTRQYYERGSISGNATPLVDTVQGFTRAGDYNVSAGLSTKIYSEASFKGTLKKLRLVSTPSLSLSYRPDFGDPKYGYYRTIVSGAVLPYQVVSSRYSIYQYSVYGGPSQGKSASLNLNVDNTLEGKLKARSTDTSGADRKISILQGLSFATSYNFAADSFRLSPISFNAHTTVLNQKVSLSLNGVLDPYASQIKDSISNNQIQRFYRRIDRYTFQDGKFPTLNTLNFSMNFSLNSSKNKRTNSPPSNTLQSLNRQQADELALINSDPEAYVDFNVPYNVNVNYNFTYNNGGLTKTISNTINASGDVNVTPKWKVQYTTGFDVKAAKITTTSFSIYRDLHCWDLSFRWLPFGYYKSFSVDLRVKASILQDLKLSKRKDYYNNQ